MNKYKKYAIVVGLATIVVWGLSFCLQYFGILKKGFNYADLFEPVNALFSGLAFAGLIITLIMQHDELGLQRNELIQTNKELAAQREQFTAQTKTMQIQRFENTLFNMLSLQQGIVNGLDYKFFDGTNKFEYKGKNVFDFFYNMKTTKLPYGDDIKYWGIKDLISDNDDINVYPEAEEISIFDSYFRHLYRIFKYIDESPLIDNTERYNYSSIVRAQLSEYELLVLFYNALTNKDNGEFKFKDLIEKYAIFNNIRVSMLARGREDYKLYNEGAYIHKA